MKEILKFLKTSYKKKKKFKQLKEGSTFCILKGIYAAEYFVFIEKKEDVLMFFSLPDKQLRKVPEKALLSGLRDNIIEFIEYLPEDVFKVLYAEYKSINKI